MTYGKWKRRFIVALPDGSHVAECATHDEARRVAASHVGSRIQEWFLQEILQADPNRPAARAG